MTRFLHASVLIACTSASASATYAQRMTTFTWINPAGGETYAADSIVQIQWSSVNPTGYVDITLLKGGQEFAAAGFVPMEANQTAWEVCPILPNGSDYALRLAGMDSYGNAIELTSGLFSITGSVPAPSVSITVPTAGASWEAGRSQTIEWTATDPAGHVYIDLLQDGTLVREIGYAAVADGTFTWHSCSALPAGPNYAVRLSTDGCGPGPTSTSELFAITSPPGSAPLELSVLAPTAGQGFTAGAALPITWSVNDDHALITLDLLRNDEWHAHIGAVPGFPATLNYAICPDIGDGSDYRVRLLTSDACGAIVEAVSEPFTISGSSPRPAAQVFDPAGQTIWVQGTTQNVLWQTQDLSDVVVVGLLKGGVWRSTLAYVTPPEAVLAWSIPIELPDALDYRVAVRQPRCHSVIEDTGDLFTLRAGAAVVQSDADVDGDVDMDDFGGFQLCHTGAGVPQTFATCRRFDLDNDGDVDADDLGLLSQCASGANAPQADAECDLP